MNSRGYQTNGATEDQLLAELVEEYTTRLQAGERVHWSDFATAHPERAEGLRRLLPALDMLADAGAAPPGVEGEPGPCVELDELLNSQLGDYRLVREIGRGGMGIVYEAEQSSLERRVAIKVLPFASLLDSRQLQRFHNEARAAACLHHDHIVPVFAVGCERGIHYYAMQFIEGQSLDQLLWGFQTQTLEQVNPAGHSPHAASTVPQGMLATLPEVTVRLPVRRIVQLVIQAGRALDHAHQQGIVHRDVKPANLLVNREGNHLWITDFGLARCQGDANLTRTGDLLGTLRYMSPEQALAKPGLVDQRTDIYALGATLYELLTLRPVFSGQTRQELLRQIADQEPIPLRRLDRSLPVELETVVLKALAKNASERYASAHELADDLQRYLDDRPILARRPRIAEKLVRWGRRHKSLVAASSIAAAALIITLAASTIIILSQRNEARGLKDTARAAVDDMYLGFVQKWLSQKPQLESEQRDLLIKALHFYERFAQESGVDPQVRLRVAQAEHCVADIQTKLGESALAEEAYRQAISVLEDLEKNSPHLPGIANALAGCWNDLGNLQRDKGQPAQAEPSYRNARGLFARQAKLTQDQASAWVGLAGSSMNLGRLLGGRQQNQEAESLLREAITIDRHWLAENPQAASWRYDLAAALGNLADSLGNLSRFDEAEACYKEALALWAGLTTEFPERLNYHQGLIAGRCGLAALFASRGNPIQAEGAYREAIASALRLASAYPRVRDYARTLASARIRLARTLSARGQMVEADEILQEALAQLDAFRVHPDKLPVGVEEAVCACELGEIRENKKDLQAAEKFYRQAVARLDALTTDKEETPEIAWLRGRIAGGLANVLFDTGRRVEAGEACALALSLKSRLAASHPEVAGYQADVAWSLLACLDPAQRDPQKAIGFAIRATDLRPRDAAAWFVRGVAEFRGGRLKEALTSLEKCRQLGNEEDPASWFYLALSYRTVGEPAKASYAMRRGEIGFAKQAHPERTLNEVREERYRRLLSMTFPP